MPELTIPQWIDRCATRLLALDPDSPLDGTDWDDIAGDLWAAAPDRTPDAAADEWHRLNGPVRALTQQR